MKFTDKIRYLREVYCEIYIEENIENWKPLFVSRGHPEQMVEKTLWEFKYKNRKEALIKKTRTHKKLLDFVTQFQPHYQNLKSIIKDKWRIKYKYSERYSRSNPWTVIAKENRPKACL